MTAYFSLLLISFLAATIFPFSSELALASLLIVKNYNSLVLIGVASLGNILGSAFNWFLGFYLLRYINKRWFPFKETQIKSVSKKFNKFGLCSLLFAWLPVVGDPLTFIAGVLKVNFILFLILVSIGKISRYFFIFYLTNI
tara:strand:+ start:1327 stop:1749 length:423 start_codon:yes stop_codon:yes gene_type:complete